MARRSSSKASPIDLSQNEIEIIRERIQSCSAFWGVRSTRAPGPSSRIGGIRWLYAFWDGPPSNDIVPALALERLPFGYQITILQPLELFVMGAFETLRRNDFPATVELIVMLLEEVRETALNSSTMVARSATATKARFNIN